MLAAAESKASAQLDAATAQLGTMVGSSLQASAERRLDEVNIKVRLGNAHKSKDSTCLTRVR
jgi:hypothetical protein